MKRYKDARRVSILGIAGNIFLFIIKIIVGVISNSEAMISDAFNSASDVFNSFMTFIGNKIASKKADEDHNLGNGKAEYIYSLFISLTMIVLGIKLVTRDIKLFMNPEEYHYSIWLVIVALTTIITKLCLYLYSKKIGDKYNNLLVKANSKDHRNDIFLTSMTLVSIILSYNSVKYIDIIVGILIALWIIFNGLEIFRESYDILMDKTMPDDIKEKVLDIIKEHKEIEKITHFNATPVGYLYQVSFSIFVDGNMKTFESHKIADDLEKEIDKRVPEIYLTVIHVNPL